MQIRILLVDDDEAIRSLVSEGIKSCLGGRALVIEASSGNEAIALLEQGAAFQAIVSDYQMTDGTGTDLLDYLNRSGRTTPFVLFSGSDEISLPEKGSNFFGVIRKDEFPKLKIFIVNSVTAIEGEVL